MTSAAVTVASWGKSRTRSGFSLPANIPGPMNPAGNVYSGDANAGPIGLTVEIYLGDRGWENISAYCYYRDRVKISRGKPNETSTAQPQTCTLTLNNRDGRFSPKNALGPYFGLIGRNTPLRVSRYQNGIKRYRFHGEVTAWPTTWDISGSDVYAPITAAGMLRRIAQGTTPLGSPMFRAYALHTSPTLNPVAYWPCEDGSSAVSFAPGMSGVPAMVFTGSPQLSSNSGFVCSQPIPVVNNSVWAGAVPVSTGWTDNVTRFLMQVPSSGDTDGAIIATMLTTGTVRRADLIYHAGGSLQLKALDATGATLADTGNVTFAVNGELLRVSMGLRAVGANISVEIGTLTVGGSAALVSGVTLNSATVGAVTEVLIGYNGNLASTAIGHISVQNLSDSLFDLASPLNAWNGENPSVRLLRVCGEQGIPASIAVVPNQMGGNTVTMGQQGDDTLPTVMQQITDTDLGPLYEARDRLSLMYRSRLSLYNQGTQYNNSRPALVLDAAQNQLSAALNPVDDDAFTRNDITVQRTGGSSAAAVQSSGTLSTQSPPAGVGDYPYTYSLSLGDDGQLADQAGWRLHTGTVDEPRYPQISVNLRHPTFTGNLDRLNAALSLDIGDRVAIDNPPPWLPADQISQILLGYSETLGIFEHDMILNCAPESPWRVGMLEDLVLSRFDTDGSTLASGLSAVLNPNGYFAGGSLAGWSATSCTPTILGTIGSAQPLPSGGPTGYGVMLTASGGSSLMLEENGAPFAVSPLQAYQVSALVNYPSAAHTAQLGIGWFDSTGTLISRTTSFTAVTAGTWTALSVSENAPSNAANGYPIIGLGGTPTAGDVVYFANVVAWSGAVSVATANSTSPLWTTSGGDFPFDVRIGGEQMTVTNITGASSPQAFTVARGINGVVPAQSAGADVRLNQPTILSL